IVWGHPGELWRTVEHTNGAAGRSKPVLPDHLTYTPVNVTRPSLKVVPAIPPIGQCTFKRTPKGSAVIWLNEMAQLVDDDVVYQLDWKLQRPPIKIESSIAAA